MWKLLILIFFLIFITKKVTSFEGRIVGGRLVSIVKHPHQISLRFKGCKTCNFAHRCGGSIYSEDVIISAAHCVVGRSADEFMVVAGTENRSGADGVIAPVESIITHEDYNPIYTDNDYAVIFLSIPLPLNNVTIAAIPLAIKHPDNGVKSLVTGWGTTAEGGSGSAKLLEAEVRIVSNELCNQAYGVSRITDSMLCAGVAEGGKDACQGDSGGPLVVNGTLVGIVSWGRGCARPDFPGVYASVAFGKQWIEEKILLRGEKFK